MQFLESVNVKTVKVIFRQTAVEYSNVFGSRVFGEFKFISSHDYLVKLKCKVIPLQARCGPDGG